MRGTFFRLLKLIGAFMFFLALQSFLIAPASADDSMTAVCYANGKPVGNVVIFSTDEAARACNITYYDCRGKCVGCFHDFDYVENVCVDLRGSTFLKY